MSPECPGACRRQGRGSPGKAGRGSLKFCAGRAGQLKLCTSRAGTLKLCTVRSGQLKFCKVRYGVPAALRRLGVAAEAA